MTSLELQFLIVRSGTIPYYVQREIMWVKVMKPSDPKFGGPEWQMAKGEMEPGLTLEQNALKEAHEEVGLKASNIRSMFKLTERNNLHIYAAEVVDPYDFDEPHWETGAVAWLQLPHQLDQIRDWQQQVFEMLYNKIIS